MAVRLRCDVANAGLEALMEYAYERDEQGKVSPKDFKSGVLASRLARNIRYLSEELTEHRQFIQDVEAKKGEFFRAYVDTLPEEQQKDIREGKLSPTYQFTDEELEELKELQQKVIDTAKEIISYEPVIIPEDVMEGASVNVFFRAPWVFDESYKGEAQDAETKAAD